MDYTPYQYLPLFAKLAIERLDADESLRCATMLDTFLDAYAQTYGRPVEDETRESAHYHCAKRFWNFVVDK